MSAIAAITINDGQATPVAHTFNPIQTDPASYRENGSASTPVIGQPAIDINIKQASGSDAVNRAKVSLRFPVLETVSGESYAGYVAAPKVAYFLQANVEFLLPNRSTLAQRKDLRVLLMNALANAQIVSVVDSLEKPY
jgi:hypothetical protein